VERVYFSGSDTPPPQGARPQRPNFLWQMLMRDLFAVANLLVFCYSGCPQIHNKSSLWRTDPCQLYYMSNATSNLDAYLGQYYELQDDTFGSSASSPVYVTRSNASVWLHYSFDAGRWELVDRISDVSVVVYAFSSSMASYDAPPAVTDWTFPAENVTVTGVTLSCTCK